MKRGGEDGYQYVLKIKDDWSEYVSLTRKKKPTQIQQVALSYIVFQPS